MLLFELYLYIYLLQYMYTKRSLNMIKSIHKFIVCILFLLVSLSLAAKPESTFDRVTFSVTVVEEVRSDTIIGNLGISVQGKDTSAMAGKINSTIRAALDSIKKFSAIEAETLNYQTQPVYEQGRQSGLWKVSQSIQIKSRDFEQFSKAVHKLQQSLNLLSVNYQLSSAVRSATEDRLTTNAIKRFSERAQQLSNDFGFKDYRIVSVNLGGSPRYTSRPVETAMRMEMDLSAPPPVFQAGKQQVNININGTIEMLR